jgi:hypothetical protein
MTGFNLFSGQKLYTRKRYGDQVAFFDIRCPAYDSLRVRTYVDPANRKGVCIRVRAHFYNTAHHDSFKITISISEGFYLQASHGKGLGKFGHIHVYINVIAKPA